MRSTGPVILIANVKLSPLCAAVRIVSVLAFAVVAVEAKPLAITGTARPATEASCCAMMAQNQTGCPPVSGMNGSSCCNLQLCLQLFLQTTELRLAPSFAEFRWEQFAVGASVRSDPPPGPPPRA